VSRSSSKPLIDESGVHGSLRTETIYLREFPDLRFVVQVGLGRAGSDPTEVVEIVSSYLTLRVRAEDVRADLRVLLVANRDWEMACYAEEKQAARDQAFLGLEAAAFVACARRITFERIGEIAHLAYEDGLRNGKREMRDEFRRLLGIT